MNENERALLPVRDVAERLGVSLPTAYRRVADGSLPAFRVCGSGPIRVPREVVDRALVPVVPREASR